MPRPILLGVPTELEFTAQVLAYAKLCGWRTAHFRPARTARGWVTPVQGDGKGFLDLLLLRAQRIVVAELKRTALDRPTPEQELWLAAWRETGRAEVCVWTASDDWGRIERTLR
jgi:hypothetical protein